MKNAVDVREDIIEATEFIWAQVDEIEDSICDKCKHRGYSAYCPLACEAAQRIYSLMQDEAAICETLYAKYLHIFTGEMADMRMCEW